MSITVPFKVMAQGYQVKGSSTSGYQATVPFLVAWQDAYVFADELMGRGNAQVVGPITYYMPMLFPGTAARLYATDFTIVPIGQNGQPLAEFLGLAPGEFFTNAIVTVDFATLPYQLQQMDDPNNLQQLDPNNPITLCEQSFKMSGKMRSRKGSGYIYSDGTPLVGDIAVVERETRLVLKFPKLPYLPWQLVQSYVGSLNNDTVLQCPMGTLIFEGGESQFTATNAGIQGQMMVLEFTWQDHDWNMVERPDNGQFDMVYQKGYAGDSTKQIFKYKDLTQLFLTVDVVP